jgi:uncharacterized secreted protein with C-terminal beta-propeller domain
MSSWLAARAVGRRARAVGAVLLGAGLLAILALMLAPASESAVHRWHGGRVHQLGRVGSRPRAFDSCAALVRYGRRYLALTRGLPEAPLQPVPTASVPPGAVGAPSPSAGAPTTIASGSGGYSTTNNQEPGVDEPDTVKTDGSTIFAIASNRLEAVAVANGGPQLVGSLDLGVAGYGSQLLLRGQHLIVISGQSGVVPVLAGPGGRRGLLSSPRGGGEMSIAPSPYYYAGKTALTEVDVSDPKAMKVVRTITIDGSFVDARENGGTARIVISSPPPVLAYPALRGRVLGYLPRWRFHSLVTGRRFVRPVARCGQVEHPAVFSGLGMVTIFTIDIDRGLWTAGADALMADAQIVYGSPGSLYLATERWIDPATPASRLPSRQTTQIDRFDATLPDSTPFVASGEVPGFLLNQFSLSEWGSYLRVASTSVPDWWDGTVPHVPSQSYVTVLATNGSALTPVGQVSGLGAGQKIYSVRFVGDTGYVVTFRQVDPLYTIDVSNPTAPRVAGQLELQGYSAYLHPLGNGLLLGVGQDVEAGNEPTGSQLEVFAVNDPSAPRLLGKVTLGQGSSTQVTYDHHAFLFWPPTGLAVLPVQIYPAYAGAPVTGSPGTAPAGGSSSTDGFTGAIGFHIDGSGIHEVGRVSHPQSNGYTPPITRSVVIGNQLYTLSDSGILASSLDTLSPETFVQFPAPPARRSPIQYTHREARNPTAR